MIERLFRPDSPAISKRTNLVTFCLGSGTAGDVDFLFACDVFGEVEKLPCHAKAFGNLIRLKTEMQIASVDSFKARLKIYF